MFNNKQPKILLSVTLLLISVLGYGQLAQAERAISLQSDSNTSSTQQENNDVTNNTKEPSYTHMCLKDEFLNSVLVKGKSWPGFGPFKAQDNNADLLVDSSQNEIFLVVDDNKIRLVQFTIAGRTLDQKTSTKEFLDLEVISDFLLEAAGANSSAIAKLNSAFENNKQNIINKSNNAPIYLKAGHYLVNLEQQYQPNSDKVAYVLHLSKSNTQEPVIASETEKKTESGKVKSVFHLKPPALINSTPSTQVSSPKTITELKKTESNSTNKTIVAESSIESKKAAKTTINDAVKTELTNTIKNWQSIKQIALFKRQSDQLSSCLSGRALQRQTDAVKWLIANNKHYEMTPLSVAVNRYVEISPGKYSVFATVKETSKLVDETSGKIIKLSTDTYKVNYTIEKGKEHYLISDSVLANNSASPTKTKSEKH